MREVFASEQGARDGVLLGETSWAALSAAVSLTFDIGGGDEDRLLDGNLTLKYSVALLERLRLSMAVGD